LSLTAVRSHLKIRIFVPRVKPGIFDKVKKDPSFQPQEYCCISRTGNEHPKPKLGEKTILRWLLDEEER